MPVPSPISKLILTDPSRPMLLIQPGALGDSILSLHVADQLREAFPGSPIEMLGHLGYIRLFAGRSSIATVSDIDTAPLHTLFTDPPSDLPPAFADYLHRFSAVITWLGEPDTPFAHNLSSAIDGPVFFIDRGPPLDYPNHVVHYWLSQLFPDLSSNAPVRHPGGASVIPDFRLGDPAEIRNPESSNAPDLRVGGLSLSAQDIATASIQLSELLPWPIDTTDYFVFHPGAGSPDKCWPIDSFVQLAHMIQTRTNYRVIYLIGPTEKERFSPAALETLRNSAPVLSDLDIVLAAALIHRSRGFLGHDTGPTHLAAALGLPTLAIFGPTDPTHWQPLGPAARFIRPAPGRSKPSLSAVTVSQVYQTIAGG